MNTDDLRSLLTERAGETVGGGPTSDARIAGIRGKARAIRTRRIAGVGGAVAAVAAIVVSGLLPNDVSTVHPEPAKPWQDLVLEEYAHGGKLIGEARVDALTHTASVTVPSEAFPLTLLPECSRHLRFEVTAEDEDTEPFLVQGGECGAYEAVDTLTKGDPSDSPTLGADRAVTLTVTLEAAMDDTGEDYLSTIPDDAGVAFGVYEQVKWDEYEFPPRPDELFDLDRFVGAGPYEGGVVAESRDDPNAPVTVQFTGDGVSLDLRSQTPGRMKILIEGEEVAAPTFWDYSGRSFNYSTGWQGSDYDELPEDGVEVTFVPRDFTGAWRAALVRCDLDDDGSGVGCGPL